MASVFRILRDIRGKGSEDWQRVPPGFNRCRLYLRIASVGIRLTVAIGRGALGQIISPGDTLPRRLGERPAPAGEDRTTLGCDAFAIARPPNSSLNSGTHHPRRGNECCTRRDLRSRVHEDDLRHGQMRAEQGLCRRRRRGR